MQTQSLPGTAETRWVPEKRSDGRVEISVRYYDDNLLRNVLASVPPQRFIALWDAGLLKFQRENLERPEGCPTREEVAAFLRGDIKAVSRRKDGNEWDNQPRYAKDPPAYHLNERVRERLGLSDSEELDNEVEVRKARPGADSPVPTKDPPKPVPAVRPPPVLSPEAAEMDAVYAELGWDVGVSVTRFHNLAPKDKEVLRAEATYGSVAGMTRQQTTALADRLCSKLMIPVNQRGFRRRNGLQAVIARYDAR